MADRVAMVTGAGSGIGLATARMLESGGWRVVLVGRRKPALDQAAVGMSPERALVAAGDMSVPGDIERVVDEAARWGGRIDLLVNNAGAGEVLPIGQTDWAALRRMFDLNALGVAYLIHKVWPVFAKQQAGCIVNVSSYAAMDPFAGFFAYGATKAAVNLLSFSAAKEGAAIGVRAFSVAPGAVETPLLRSLADETVVPRAWCLEPEEVGRIIVECAEGRRDLDNGKTIYIRRDTGASDGGVHERVV